MLCILVLLALSFLTPLCNASSFIHHIPNFSDYAGKEIAKTETHDGQMIYFLSEDNASSVLGAYAELLESEYGFRDIHSETVDSIGYIWFANHTIMPPNVFEDIGLEGTYSFLFTFSQAENGLVQVTLLPDNGFIMMDTGERFANVVQPTATPTPVPTLKPGKECDKCNGTGKCQNCGGDAWFEGYKWVWQGLGGSGYESEYVVELCHDDNCYDGSCKACDGDGVI